VATDVVIPMERLLPSALNLGTGTSDLLVDTDRVTAGPVPCLLVGGPAIEGVIANRGLRTSHP
jgi:hypothetical protein